MGGNGIKEIEREFVAGEQDRDQALHEMLMVARDFHHSDWTIHGLGCIFCRGALFCVHIIARDVRRTEHFSLKL